MISLHWVDRQGNWPVAIKRFRETEHDDVNASTVDELLASPLWNEFHAKYPRMCVQNADSYGAVGHVAHLSGDKDGERNTTLLAVRADTGAEMCMFLYESGVGDMDLVRQYSRYKNIPVPQSSYDMLERTKQAGIEVDSVNSNRDGTLCATLKAGLSDGSRILLWIDRGSYRLQAVVDECWNLGRIPTTQIHTVNVVSEHELQEHVKTLNEWISEATKPPTLRNMFPQLHGAVLPTAVEDYALRFWIEVNKQEDFGRFDDPRVQVHGGEMQFDWVQPTRVLNVHERGYEFSIKTETESTSGFTNSPERAVRILNV